MRSVCRQFGRAGGGVGVSIVGPPPPHVRQHLSVKDWFRRLGWRGLWLVAQRSMYLWLAEPTYTESRAITLSRRNRRLGGAHIHIRATTRHPRWWASDGARWWWPTR